MSVSLTGRHRDWLSLTLRSIRSNSIQARYGHKAGEGVAGMDREKVFYCDQFVPFALVGS